MTKGIKNSTKKITYEIAQERFVQQGRTDIKLCEDGFFGWKKKSKFYDKIEQDYFWSLPADVYRHKIVHPNRRQQKKEKNNLKKWGVKYPTQAKEIKEKTKQTCLKKYGKEYYLQTEEVKEKTKQTSLKKYGVEHFTQAEKVKNKYRQTCLKKYGVDNVGKIEMIRNKAEKTNIKKYGYPNPSYVKQFKLKKEQTSLKNWGNKQPLCVAAIRTKAVFTNVKKYGKHHHMLSKKYSNNIVSATGEHLNTWLEKQPEPKPSYATIVNVFKKNNSIKEVENFLINYSGYKTFLEVQGEQLFNMSHYNKKPKQISGLYRPDFKLTDNVFVNVDGLYWHSELHKERRYHFNIRNHFEENNLKIIQFREDELKNKSDICKSIVNNAIGKTQNKIYARKCIVKTVPHKEAKIFLEQNHLMGSTTAKHIGLYFKDNLISLISYKEKKYICKIERFCSLVNYNIVGSFSKLLNYLEKHCLKSTITEIHNWVDLRYGTGKHLLNKGFVQTKETLGWKWTDGKKCFNRLKCKANMDSRKLTQQQHANELGWFKIYDAGQRLYIKEI